MRSIHVQCVWLVMFWLGACASEVTDEPGLRSLRFELPTVTIPPGEELYKCKDFSNPFGSDIAIVDSSSDLSVGVHHFLAFVMAAAQNNGVPLSDGELVDCPSGGLEFHDFVHQSARRGQQHIVYPKGVGRFVARDRGFRLNIHLINAGNTPLQASVAFELRYLEASKIAMPAGGMFLNNIGVSVPPGMSTQSATFELPYAATLLYASGHMHRRGVHFIAKTNTGLTLFETSDWSEPEWKALVPAIELAKGTQIEWSCTYLNSGDTTIPFGQSAFEQEMCVFPATFIGGDGNSLNNWGMLL